jgi:hypothetical protein
VLEMQVSPYACYCLSLLHGWCCLCWRCKCLLTPVIACLFFVASVVYVGDASVSLRLLLFVSSSWLVLSVLEMQVYCIVIT